MDMGWALAITGLGILIVTAPALGSLTRPM
jgi:hypothetical protein